MSTVQELPGSAPLRRADRLDFAAAAFAAAAAFLVYLPSLGNGFLLTWDDPEFVVDNQVIRSLSMATVREAFFGEALHYFAPLTWLSYAVDVQLWGQGPFGIHLGSALLHAGCAALVFLVAQSLLGAPAIGLPGGPRRLGALLAALCWALHPLRVETVAWAAERKGVLSLLFGLAATLAWLRHAASGRPAWRSPAWAAALLLFAAALLSKPTLVTLPLVLLVLEAWPLGRFQPGRRREVLLELAPLLALAAGVTLHFTVRAAAPLTMSLDELGVVSRLLVALRATWDYLRLTAWPAGLSPFYLHPGAVGPGDLAFLLPSLAIVAATVALAWRARRFPAVAAAWFAWLAALAPGHLSTQVSATSMADRFTYFPGVILAVLAGGAAAAGVARLERRRAVLAGAALAALLAALGALTVRQATVWRDDVALWSRPTDLEPGRSGRVYAQRSFAREQLRDWAGARADLDQAIAIAEAKGWSQVHTLHVRRAQVLDQLGLLEEAVTDLGQALETDRSMSVVPTLRERARLLRRLQREDQAALDERMAEELGGTAPGR